MNEMREDHRRQLRAVVEAGQTGRVASAAAVRARGDQRRRRKAAGVGALAVLVLGLGAGAFVANQHHTDAHLSPAASRSASPATPSPSASPATPSPSASPATSSPPGGARWAGQEHFMEISNGELRNGQLVLSVRVASKEVLGESFTTKPGTGPFTQVEAGTGVVVTKMDGQRQPITAFVADLARRKNPVEGFTVRFGADGYVSQIKWEYVLD